MLRWWDNEDTLKCEKDDEEDAVIRLKEQLSRAESIVSEGVTKEWTFKVRADTAPGEVLCVTGDCFSLGYWNYDRVLVLKKDEDSGVWSGIAKVPVQKEVQYRYCVCIVVEPDLVRQTSRQFTVRRWETNLHPRKIDKDVLTKFSTNSEPDTFGFYDNHERVERGWLTTETAIQLKLFNNPIEIWKSKLQGRKIYVKVTPVNLTRANSQENNCSIEETLSLETMDLMDKEQNWPMTEIAVMNEAERDFHLQEQFGQPYNNGDFMIFQVQMHNPETVAYLMDFYCYGRRAAEGEPPYHIGLCYILPSALKHSEGQVLVPITSVQHKPIGQVTVEYLVVKPIASFKCDMKISLQRQWKDSWHGLDVGHRGVGCSFKGEVRQCADVRENTIASLKAAASHGADFVEFDVQLSRDLIPVLYHDFYICISMKKRGSHPDDMDMLQIPVKDLSLDQLHLLKVYHLEEGRSKHSRFLDDELEEHQPFPTLQQALEVLDPNVGFNVELKWTMQLKDGTYELYHPFDLNLYLDIVLEVVLKHAGNRNIIFSCFHPDICSMIRLKQNKYPVMFLTQGITDKYPPYHDARCQNVPMAVHFAVNMGILGINVHTEDLLRDSSQVSLVKQAGLVLFCWGDDNNDVNTIKHLKELGLHAIIYDKIDQVGVKEVKESIFRLEARESERLVIRAAAERAEKDKNEKENEAAYFEVKETHYLNKDKAEEDACRGSVASCISLWTNNNGDQSAKSLPPCSPAPSISEDTATFKDLTISSNSTTAV